MEHLVLFAKVPVEGRVKTRLVPPLSGKGALRLYRAFLRDQLAMIGRLSGPSRSGEVCLDRARGRTAIPASWTAGLTVELQGPGDLGRRMLRAFTRSARGGASATVIVGADAPTLPDERVREGFRRMRGGAEAVVCPAEDGGYVLLGLRRPRPELFRKIACGPDVFRQTRLRAREAGIRLEELEGWYDVDDAGALRRLRNDLRRPAARRRAPATAALLLDAEGAGVV